MKHSQPQSQVLQLFLKLLTFFVSSESEFPSPEPMSELIETHLRMDDKHHVLAAQISALESDSEAEKEKMWAEHHRVVSAPPAAAHTDEESGFTVAGLVSHEQILRAVAYPYALAAARTKVEKQADTATDAPAEAEATGSSGSSLEEEPGAVGGGGTVGDVHKAEKRARLCPEFTADGDDATASKTHVTKTDLFMQHRNHAKIEMDAPSGSFWDVVQVIPLPVRCCDFCSLFVILPFASHLPPPHPQSGPHLNPTDMPNG
jgi:hypothetical protein